MAILRALRGANPGQVFPIEGEVAILGRHPDCDIVLEAPAVSRQHARIIRQQGRFFIEDLNSRNGTLVNGRPVIERQILNENDEIQICDLSFVFHNGPGADPGSVTDEIPAMVVDDEMTTSNSTVMSKLSVSAGTSGLHLQVNAEAKLKALIEIGQKLGRALNLGQVLSGVLDSLFTIFIQADRGFVVLHDKENGRLIPKAVKHRGRDEASRTIRISRTIVRAVMETKEAVLSADAASDSRFDMAESVLDFHIRSIMCAPLVGTDGKALGVLQVDSLDQRNRFSRDDLDVLASVACQAAVAVENAQLHETAIRDRAIERELAVAHQVQQGFLPNAPPSVEGYAFYEFYEPANKLGGDYFDYIILPDGRIAVIVADVSGKGIAASLLMARLSAEARFSLASVHQPSEAVARLNRTFCDASWEDRFVTFVVSVLDAKRHEVTVVNAGHMPPLVRRANGAIETLGEAETRLPLGVDGDMEYPQRKFAFGQGDYLAMYTDGVTEAMNDQGELYGRQRLLTQLAQDADGVRNLGRRIIQDVRRFTGSRAQSDDMCLTCFERV
jgi:phosphoserine phosphatase RsbU/P